MSDQRSAVSHQRSAISGQQWDERTTIKGNLIQLAQIRLDKAAEILAAAQATYRGDHSEANLETLTRALTLYEQMELEMRRAELTLIGLDTPLATRPRVRS